MNGAIAAATDLDLAAIVEALPVGITVFDSMNRIVIMNSTFRHAMGLDPRSFPPGITLSHLAAALALRGVFGPGDREAQIQAVLTTDRSRPGRIRRQTYAGRSYDIYNTPRHDGGFIISMVDVTEMLAARADAEGAMAQTATALATLRIGLAVFNPLGTLLLSNPRFAELVALPPERLVSGMSYQAMLDLMQTREEYSGHDGTAFIASLRAAQPDRSWTTRRLRDNGQLIDVMIDPLPAGGRAITVSDITPLARAEDEARRRADLLDSVLNAVPHGICVYGPDRRVTMFNHTYIDVMQGAPLQIGDHLQDVIRRRVESREYGPGEPGDIYDHQMSFDISRPQSRRRVRPNGSAIDVRTAPLPDGGHISVVTDISALVQAETQARHARDVAETANKAKSRFLATMSHELRTPLNAIIGFSDTLMRDSKRQSPAEIADYSAQINAAGKQLLVLIDTILDVARIESGRFEPAVDRTDVAQVVRTAVRQVYSAAQAAEVTLTVEVPDDLPRLRADERRMLQAVSQLLSNAVKFTPEGGSVTVSATVADDGALRIRVADTGIGVAEVDLDRVFEPFIQLDEGLSRRYGGSGLGLYIARAIVEAQGGSIRLASTPGQGTTAEIQLPARCVIR
ncbi:MAG: PAS-domain containing protein [Proteobacteria bacterium]|nr:PAS-domain containing protein [Pseudomonadota bacterium]